MQFNLISHRVDATPLATLRELSHAARRHLLHPFPHPVADDQSPNSLLITRAEFRQTCPVSGKFWALGDLTPFVVIAQLRRVLGKFGKHEVSSTHPSWHDKYAHGVGNLVKRYIECKGRSCIQELRITMPRSIVHDFNRMILDGLSGDSVRSTTKKIT